MIFISHFPMTANKMYKGNEYVEFHLMGSYNFIHINKGSKTKAEINAVIIPAIIKLLHFEQY